MWKRHQRPEAEPGDAAILARVHQEMQKVYEEVVHPLYLQMMDKGKKGVAAVEKAAH